LIAAGAIRVFQEMGSKVPQEVAIIGFDDMPLCSALLTSLSTVAVSKEAMGRRL